MVVDPSSSLKPPLTTVQFQKFFNLITGILTWHNFTKRPLPIRGARPGPIIVLAMRNLWLELVMQLSKITNFSTSSLQQSLSYHPFPAIMPLIYRDEFGGRSKKASYSFPDSAANIPPERFPWLRDEAAPNPAKLCNKCRQLDFVFLFNHLLSETAVESDDGSAPGSLFYGISLGYIGDVREYDGCAFCSLVCTALDQFHPQGYVPNMFQGQQVQCFLSNIRRGPKGSYLVSSANTALDDVQLSLRTEPVTQTPLSGDSDIFDIQPANIVRLNDTGEIKKRLVIPRRLGSLVDVGLLRQWVQTCCDSTPTSEGGVAFFKLRLIDVHRGSVTGLVTPSRYVALSYVWGPTKQFMLTKSNHIQMMIPGAITAEDTRFPRTIREAIILCKKLGEAYLWVDSLCIIQDSDEDKVEQLNLMDLVYQEAVFTLVSAAGDSADSPLPGVSLRATKQQLVQVQGLHLFQTLRNFEHTVNPSIWNSRGWTYQERVLSPRNVIFTTEQLFFECEHGKCSEDLFVDFHSYGRPLPVETTLEDTPYRIPTYEKLNWDVYTSLVEAYTNRHLSYSNDILNAFKGISHVIQRRIFDESPMIYGIPLCVLDFGILWQPAGCCERRTPADSNNSSEFPSWTWAGWIGPAKYPTLWNISERTIPAVEWYLFIDRPGEPSDLKRRIPREHHGIPSPDWQQWQDWERHVSDSDIIHYTCVDKDPRCRYSHPIDPGITTEQSFISRMSHLGILADTATLNVPGDHAHLWSADYRCAEGQHAVCELTILDAKGRRVGIVVLDGNTASSLPSREYTFIKLSQTTLSSGRDDPAWCEETESFAGKPGEQIINTTRRLEFAEDEEIFDPKVYPIDICWCLYNVMLVETKEDVTYRIGIGQVHIHAFDAAVTERKLMRLG
jgi:hypothetical protein